jgi:hypothetical protein
MNHPTYQLAGVIALLVAMTAALFLRRFLTKSADSPGRYKLFGWFQAAAGTLCVAMYYLGEDPTPDTIALGWALVVFGGYMVESGRLRQRISDLESKLDSLAASSSK